MPEPIDPYDDDADDVEYGTPDWDYPGAWATIGEAITAVADLAAAHLRHRVVMAGYWIRPYDQLLDRRRWRWQADGHRLQARAVHLLTEGLASGAITLPPPPRDHDGRQTCGHTYDQHGPYGCTVDDPPCWCGTPAHLLRTHGCAP